MKKVMIGLVMAASAMPAMAGELAPAEKRMVAYEQCILLAAVRVSYTQVANDQVYRLARAACASAREDAVGRYARQPALLAAFDAADAQRASNLGGLIDNLRERRRLSDALYGTPAR